MSQKNDKKRIFLISNMWPDHGSPGYGSFVKNVSEGLKAYGFDTVSTALIVGRPKGKLGKLRSYLKFYAQLAKGFFGRYDFIYIHFPNQAIPLLRLLYPLRHPDIVVNYHGEDLLYTPTGYTAKLGRMTDKFCSRHASAIVVPSEYYKRLVIERGIAGEDRIIVSPSGGISSEIFHATEEAQAAKRRRQSNKEPLRLGYVGRMEPEKGILTFLDVLKLLAGSDCDFRASIIGYGSEMDHTLEFIRRMGLENKVTVIPGVPQKELGSYYRDMDLLIFPSLNQAESLGLTGIESMACGTPVVGSNVGGIATYLIDGVNGFLVEPGNPQQIVEAVKRYSLMNDQQKLLMVNSGIETGKNFYRENVCRELADYFERI